MCTLSLHTGLKQLARVRVAVALNGSSHLASLALRLRTYRCGLRSFSSSRALCACLMRLRFSSALAECLLRSLRLFASRSRWLTLTTATSYLSLLLLALRLRSRERVRADAVDHVCHVNSSRAVHTNRQWHAASVLLALVHRLHDQLQQVLLRPPPQQPLQRFFGVQKLPLEVAVAVD